jgi:hypothetical protein
MSWTVAIDKRRAKIDGPKASFDKFLSFFDGLKAN